MHDLTFNSSKLSQKTRTFQSEYIPAWLLRCRVCLPSSLFRLRRRRLPGSPTSSLTCNTCLTLNSYLDCSMLYHLIAFDCSMLYLLIAELLYDLSHHCLDPGVSISSTVDHCERPLPPTFPGVAILFSLEINVGLNSI